MIKITMTNGLAYVLQPDRTSLPRPAVDDDEAAWQYRPEVYQAVKSAFLGIGYSPNYYESILDALSNIPGVANVEDLDPPSPDEGDEMDDDDYDDDENESLVIY